MRRSQSLSSSPSLEILISRCQGRIFPSPGLVGRKQFSFLVFVFKKNQTVQIPRLVPPPRVLYKVCELFFSVSLTDGLKQNVHDICIEARSRFAPLTWRG